MASATLLTLASSSNAANQTTALSPVVIGGSLPFATTIESPAGFNDALPTLHSFSKAIFRPAGSDHSQWLVLGGMTNGLHDLTGVGFDPASHNRSVHVIDPVTKQRWSRSLLDAGSGLSAATVETIATTNAQHSQIGNRLYITGGYGYAEATQDYQTFDTLTSVDVDRLVEWVKGGSAPAASSIRQIRDPLFQVTGGEMATTANGKTHLIFGQNYPSAYEPRQNGIYTHQVRTFRIVDDGSALSVTDVVAHPQSADFRRRDLNVVPIIRNDGGNLVGAVQALSGVFTRSFGAWTVPVTIDADGNASQPDPAAAGTFKQGMNGYRSATIGLYSRSTGAMHTLLLGGISYQYYDSETGQVRNDFNLPFTSDATAIVTTADGTMTQYLLPDTYPDLISPATGKPLLLGTETEFFLADGIATFANGVIDLDALPAGSHLVGWLYGGIAAEQPNNGRTFGSNAVLPVYITVPEPATAGAALLVAASTLRRNRRRR